MRTSVHAGPCLLVNLNTGIDYFGSVVNEAAKLQSFAQADEIAISPSVLAAPGVAPLLEGHTLVEGDLPDDTPFSFHRVIILRRQADQISGDTSP